MVGWCKITMTDEEKKAIDKLKRSANYFVMPIYETKIILELIEKQFKEIEELKNITKSYDSFLGTEKIVIADKKFFVNGYFRENYVSKDKIKAKIKEYYEYNKRMQNKPDWHTTKYYEAKALEKLLEE